MFNRYQAAAHHRLIASKLEAIERGELDRLLIAMPPRHGKSQLASIFFPAWYLGRNPDKRVIGCSYAAALANDFSRQARNLFGHPDWPFAVRLADDQATIQQWGLQDHRGGYVAAGVGGPITGRGADLLIIDDPVKNADEADSAVIRDSVWGWYTSTAYTRLEKGGAVVVIATRWHHDDLSGRLLREADAAGDRWDVVHLPALDEDGNALWPEKYDAAALAGIKQVVGSRVWNALYQGTPSDEESAVFKRGWWQFYRERPGHFDEVIQSWDMAFKDTATADYVVGQVWGRLGADKYLLDQVRARMSFPETVAAVRTLTAKWPQATAKLVEDKANGTAVIATLRRDLDGLIPIEPEGGKLARAHAVSPQVEAGNVYLPDASLAGWIHDFIEETAQFPTGAHDDQVDAMTQALRRLAGGFAFAIVNANTTPDPPPDDPDNRPPPAARFLRSLNGLI